MKKLIETITCADDRGNRYNIDIYQDIIEANYLSDPPEQHLGLKSYSWNSSPVMPTGDHTFHIIKIDTEVRKVA